MTQPIYQLPQKPTRPYVSTDRIFTSAMTGLYGWTTLGMLVAGITGWALLLTETYLVTSLGTLVVTFLLALGLLLASQFTARRDCKRRR